MTNDILISIFDSQCILQNEYIFKFINAIFCLRYCIVAAVLKIFDAIVVLCIYSVVDKPDTILFRAELGF